MMPSKPPRPTMPTSPTSLPHDRHARKLSLPPLIFAGLLLLCLSTLGLAQGQKADGRPPTSQTNQASPNPQSKIQNPQSKIQNPKSDVALPYETGPEPQRHTPDRQGGPDGYGYTFSDNRDPGGPVYQWQPGVQRIADTAWTLVRSGNTTDPWDDGVISYTLPFVFNFYGTNYSVIHISTNGNAHFGAPNDYWPQASNACLPSNSPYVPQAMLAPLWYDLVADPITGTVQGGVYTDIQGAFPNRTYIVEWRNLYQYGQENVRATFELLLKENGDMVFQYQSFNGGGVTGSLGVVGIQNATGTIGLPYTCYQDDLAPERAIRYRLQQAVFLQPNARTAGGAPGSTVSYTETVLNQTGIDNSFDMVAAGRTWTTTVQPANTGTIPRGGTGQVTVQVQIPAGAPLGASNVSTVTASSTLPSPGIYTSTAVLTTTASTQGANFNPVAQTRAGAYGAPVTYTLNLTNRSGQNNSFQLGVIGAEWPTTVNPTLTGSLAPDASTPITVSVIVPSNAALTAKDVITVTAAGQLPMPGQFYGQTVLITTAGVWTRKTDMLTGRSREAAVAFAPNGRIYSIGGEYNNGSADLPIEEYDPLTNAWRERAYLQVGVSNVGAAVIGNAIYIPGGYGGQPAATQNALQVYYPFEDRTDIVATDPLPAPRFGAGVAAYNGKLYVIGGSDDTLVAKNTVYEYDPARPAGSRWQTKAPMPTAREYLGAAEVDGAIYAAGGIPGNFTDLATVEAYNPATNTWSSRQPMSVGRGGLALVGVDSGQPGCGGYLYAIGGGWVNYTASAERYDPGSDRWEPLSSLSVARRTLAAAYSPVTYSLVAIGGWNGNYQSLTETIGCSGNPPAICPLEFSDVPADNGFYPYIRCLACRGIISGYSDGTFLPGNNVTRGQLAKIVSNAANFQDVVSGQTFEDVQPGTTFYTYTERLALHQVMSGYPCGDPSMPCAPPANRPYFLPANNATRGQISKIVSNAANLQDPPTGQRFEDVQPGSPFYTYTQRLTAQGVMNGYPCGDPEPCVLPTNRPYFRPGANATRGQTSKIVSNTFYPNCQSLGTR